LKEYQTIELDYYGPYNNWVYNCRTVDLVAHETGHAIIDSLKPEWEKGDAETRGIAEAFCDLTAMFLILSQKDLCDVVMTETGGDITKSNILSLFGVGHGSEENPNKEIRNAINKITYKENHWNTYSYGEVIINLFYGMLIDQLLIDNNGHERSSDILYKLGSEWIKNIVNIFLNCDNQNPRIAEFSRLLIDTNSFKNEYIKKRFNRIKFN
jgi:hypothetical protein